MKEPEISALDRLLFVRQPPLPPHKWPYRSDMGRHVVDRNIARPKAEPGECVDCVGRKMSFVPKNKRTGSLSLVECPTCRGTGRQLL